MILFWGVVMGIFVMGMGLCGKYQIGFGFGILGGMGNWGMDGGT